MMFSKASIAYKYRRAARTVDRTRKNQGQWFAKGCCSALQDEYISGYDPEFKYIKMFAPPKKGKHSWWWGNPSSCSDELHNARVLALLFAAEIAKDDV